MVILLALSIVTAPTLESFVEESDRKILKVSPGVWTISSSLHDQFLTRMTNLGSSWKVMVANEGSILMEIAGTPLQGLVVSHSDRTFARSVSDGRPNATLDPLPAIAENSFELRFDSRRGLICRINPPVPNLHLENVGNEECLVGGMHHEEGKDSFFRLSRDRKTKLPISLKLDGKDGKSYTFDFKFERRKPKPEELTIKPESYAGYQEITPPTPPSGNL